LQKNKVKYIAHFTDDKNQINEEFRMLKNIFPGLKRDYFGDSRFFTEISMGMSDNYRIALEEGSTLVRIGSEISGSR
jgi:PLP dependent protein